MSATICRQRRDSRNGPSLNRKLATSSAVLSAAVLAVSASNYGLNVMMARALTPAQFGDAALIITLMLVLTAVAVTLQLCTARRVVIEPHRAWAIREDARRLARRWGVGVGVALALLAPVLQLGFSTEAALPFIVLGIGVPWYLCQSVDRGILQGRCRFAALALTFIIEAVVRLAIGVWLLALGVGSMAASVSLCASFGVTAIVAARLARSAQRATPSPSGAAARVGGPGSQTNGTNSAVVAAATILLVGQVLINNGDVLVAKVVFNPQQAGLYASVALIGRAVFFASWAIANAAFPIIADPELSSRQRRRLSNSALCLVATFGIGTAAALVPLGPWVARMMFGPDYVGSARLLAPYALATALFAIVNLVATLDVALGRVFTPIVVLSAAIWQTVILVGVASSPESMVWLQIMVMGILTTLVGGLHVLGGLADSQNREAAANA